MKYNVYALCMILAVSSVLQANIFSDAWGKTKQTAQSTYDKAKKGWDSLGDETRTAIKNGLIAVGAIAGTAAVSGAAYYGYDQYGSNQQYRPEFTQDQATFNELISFLSTDPSYANNPSNQKLFLNRFKDQGLTEDEMRNILDIVAVETAPPVPSRDY